MSWSLRRALAAGAATALCAAAVAASVGTAGASTASTAATSTNRWRVVYQYRASYGQLQSVAAVAKNDAWATGILSNSSGNIMQPFILNWNGSSWRRVSVPGTSGFTMMEAAGTWANDVWLVGENKAGQFGFFHWDGSRWHKMLVSGSVLNEPYSVVLSARDLWAVGTQGWQKTDKTWTAYSKPEHWNGTRWQSTTINGFYLDNIGGSPSTGIWAVGTKGNSPNGPGALAAYHWNGTRWVAVSMPHPTVAAALGIGVGSARDVWIAAASTARNNANFVLHWNGASWQRSKNYGTSLAGRIVGGVIPDGHGGVWVGALHWTGRSWADTWAATAPSGLGYYQVVKVPGTSGTYWAAGLLYGSYSAHAAVAVYGPRP